jgi:hypothetical protein
MVFSNHIYFQYVLSFALQKLTFPVLCFQYVLSFVSFVAFEPLADKKSPSEFRVERVPVRIANCRLNRAFPIYDLPAD